MKIETESMKKCTICQSELINEKVYFRAKSFDEKPKGDIVIYEAWCPSCQIYLTRKSEGKKSGIWKSSIVDQKHIGNALKNDVVDNLKNVIENLDSNNDSFFLIKQLWHRFISMKKDDDEIRTYQDQTGKGLVIMRDGHRIGNFPDLMDIVSSTTSNR
jgi:hypothetical protein